MATISWGKPSKFETTPSVDRAPAESATWEEIETPKDGTLQINVTEGAEHTANEEGGGLVVAKPAGYTVIISPFGNFTNEDMRKTYTFDGKDYGFQELGSMMLSMIYSYMLHEVPVIAGNTALPS